MGEGAYADSARPCCVNAPVVDEPVVASMVMLQHDMGDDHINRSLYI